MPSGPFVHLRLHTEYSIVDGTVRVDEAVEAAAREGMPALAITDLANLFGMVKFYKAARARGVKPVIGCDVWMAPDTQREAPQRALLLCQDREGYLRLCDWLTRAYRSNQHRGRAEIRREWVEASTEGLIALCGARTGEIGQALLAGQDAQARAAARRWAQWFPDRFYLEVQRAGHPDTEELVAASVALARETGLPVVATHPIQFLRPDDFTAHEARVCIAEGYVLADSRRPRPFTAEQHFRDGAQMARAFADLPEALANATEIARRCNLHIPLGKAHLPRFPTPEGMSVDAHLAAVARAGLERRLAALFPDPARRGRETPGYQARLEFEVRTISQMGFAGYFLIVADFINWARTHGVPVGPGRGSGAGSLVAYCLGITDLDPIRYQLLFERFLNPERVSMPDFDIDFCQDGRDRVIDYVRQKYGAESVSQIATFGTMAAKAAVRDVGRVLDLPYPFVDGIAKLIPMQPGKTITLAMAREMEPQLAEREKAEEEVAQLLELAGRVEGLTRNVGMHAGGVLIAPGRLTDFCPLYAAQGVEAAVSQLDMKDVEAIGLVKFDFLGLTTLTVLDWTLRYVRRLDPASTLALESIPLDDRPTFELLARGNTTAVFQFESRGMRELLRQAPPERFEDVIALVALYRPGPMELIPDYTARRTGRERPEYLDPRLEPILGPTFGIMVYQEQVMQIAQVIGGYSLGGADLLRRAMGKKLPEEMARHRDTFVAGAVKNGMPAPKAAQLFGLMEKFAGYGFNKSHAAAYALVAYHTAYLKAHHPAAFMAANLSAVMDDTDKVRQFHEDALASGLVFLPPDVDASELRFVPIDRRTLRYGLGAIKGTGESAISAIVRARQDGPFGDLFDFCRRVDKRLVNRRVVEALVRAGAFDAIEPNRASLLATVGVALEHAEAAERSASQVSLFGESADSPVRTLVRTKPWTETERLQQEKTVLGFYLSGHPYAPYREEFAGLVRPLSGLVPQREAVLLAGLVVQVRVQVTRRGRMAFVTLDDGSAQIEVSVFSELYEARRATLEEDAVVVIEGRVSEDGYTGGLRVMADAVMDVSEARARFARRLRLACNGEANAQRLRRILEPYRQGSCPVSIAYENAAARGEIELPADWSVSLHDPLLAELREWLTPANVKIVYH